MISDAGSGSAGKPVGTRQGAVTAARLLPGLVLAAGTAAAGYGASALAGRLLPFDHNPASPLLLTILFGLVIRNALRLPDWVKPGISFGIKRLLRAGIVLMGIRVSIPAIARIGVTALAMVVICVAGALVIVHLLARRMGVNPRLGTLIAAGTSICGVSAIVAAAPLVDASENETAYAVGTITLFGLAATALYPYLTQLVFGLDPAQAGFFLGTSVHDTSQVTAAALIHHELWNGSTSSGLSVPDIAVTTKLVRNTLMIGILPLLGLYYRRNGSAGTARLSAAAALPLFVFGYIAMSAVRSGGDALFGAVQGWISFRQAATGLSTCLIAGAIACIGLNTHLKSLRKLGFRPFFIGLCAALALGCISFVLVHVFHGYLVF